MSGVVGMSSRMSGSGREFRPNVPEWSRGPHSCSGGPPGCPGVVGRPSWKSGSSREAIADFREWSGGHPGCPGGVGRPS